MLYGCMSELVYLKIYVFLIGGEGQVTMTYIQEFYVPRRPSIWLEKAFFRFNFLIMALKRIPIAFVRFILPSPPRSLCICYLTCQQAGRGGWGIPNLSLPEVFCIFLESLSFHFHMQQETGSKAQSLSRWRMWQKIIA